MPWNIYSFCGSSMEAAGIHTPFRLSKIVILSTGNSSTRFISFITLRASFVTPAGMSLLLTVRWGVKGRLSFWMQPGAALDTEEKTASRKAVHRASAVTFAKSVKVVNLCRKAQVLGKYVTFYRLGNVLSRVFL